VRLVGVDHVGFGSDFDGVIETSFDTSELAALTDALLRAGISRPDIAKVMGANTVAFLSRMLPD
ncbi:MAG: membrane dipeptidase, partial [Paracoccaceae bacterium]